MARLKNIKIVEYKNNNNILFYLKSTKNYRKIL